MSLGQITDTGRKPSKLYLITVTLTDGYDNISFSFYSTKEINTFNKFKNFVADFFTSSSLHVFGGNYKLASSTLCVPFAIRNYSSSLITLYYYTGSSWSTTQFSSSAVHSIFCEVV